MKFRVGRGSNGEIEISMSRDMRAERLVKRWIIRI